MRLVVSAVSALFLMWLPLSAAQHSKEGKKIFEENCAGCHGSDGKAQTEVGKQLQAVDLTTGDVQQLTDADMTKQIKKGKGKMPPFAGKLSDDDVRAVIAYVKELGNKH